MFSSLSKVSRRYFLFGHLRQPSKTPFNQKSSYALQQPNSEETIILKEKQQINKDFYVFSFLFKDQNKCLGNKIGDYVELGSQIKSGDNIWRPYMPVSAVDDLGFVDFLVKIVDKKDTPNGNPGEFTKMLLDSTINDRYMVRGPFTNWNYNGYGNFTLPGNQTRNVRYITMFAQDSGITAFYQMIFAISTFKYDTTSMSLFYSTFAPNDFVLVEDQAQHALEYGSLNMNFVPEKGDEDWNSLEGQISEDILKGRMPEPGKSVLNMICGTKQYKEDVKAVLNKMGYSDQEIFLL